MVVEFEYVGLLATSMYPSVSGELGACVLSYESQEGYDMDLSFFRLLL